VQSSFPPHLILVALLISVESFFFLSWLSPLFSPGQNQSNPALPYLRFFCFSLFRWCKVRAFLSLPLFQYLILDRPPLGFPSLPLYLRIFLRFILKSSLRPRFSPSTDPCKSDEQVLVRPLYNPSENVRSLFPFW